MNKPTIPIRNVTPPPGLTTHIEYKTWEVYTKTTFYLTTQYWQWEGGDALVGLGPEREIHVVVRLWDDVYEFRGPDYSISKALEELGFKCRVDHEWHEKQMNDGTETL